MSIIEASTNYSRAKRARQAERRLTVLGTSGIAMNCSFILRRFTSTGCRLLLFACLATVAQASQGWSTLTGVDGDFTVLLPAPPTRETIVTPNRPFTGQTITSYSLRAGEGYLFSMNYKDLPARNASADAQLILTEYERGLLLEASLRFEGFVEKMSAHFPTFLSATSFDS